MMNRSRPLFNIIFEIKACMSTNTRLQNHYEVLNIPQTSTQDDIKSAYYELSKKYHPDRNTSKDAKTNFQKVSDAYEILGNFAKRKQYDRDLMARGHRATVISHRSPSAAASAIRRTVEVDPLAAFYKSRLGNNHQTPIYNFDEWTHVHYGRTLKRSLEDRKEKIQRQKDRLREYQEDIENNRASNRFILISSTIVLLSLSIHSHYEKKRHDQNRLMAKRANEAKLQATSS